MQNCIEQPRALVDQIVEVFLIAVYVHRLNNPQWRTQRLV